MRESVIGALLALGIIAGGSFVPARTIDPLTTHRELKVATNSGWLPQSFLDEHNQLVGFDIDVSREIARRLGIAVKTAETHRTQLMGRLDIHDIAGLVRYAIRIGMLKPRP